MIFFIIIIGENGDQKAISFLWWSNRTIFPASHSSKSLIILSEKLDKMEIIQFWHLYLHPRRAMPVGPAEFFWIIKAFPVWDDVLSLVFPFYPKQKCTGLHLLFLCLGIPVSR